EPEGEVADQPRDTPDEVEPQHGLHVGEPYGALLALRERERLRGVERTLVGAVEGGGIHDAPRCWRNQLRTKGRMRAGMLVNRLTSTWAMMSGMSRRCQR